MDEVHSWVWAATDVAEGREKMHDWGGFLIRPWVTASPSSSTPRGAHFAASLTGTAEGGCTLRFARFVTAGAVLRPSAHSP